MRAIAAECKRRGWQLLEVLEEAGFSAEELKRPGLPRTRDVGGTATTMDVGDAVAAGVGVRRGH